MDVLIGVDEAGYGPNYGPLVVAATAWRVEEGVQGSGFRVQEGANREGATASVALKRKTTGRSGVDAPDLYKLLRKAIVRRADKAGKRIAIADSKALYSPDLGVAHLERGVLAALTTLAGNNGHSTAARGARERCVERVAELLAATLADPHRRRGDLPCHHDDEQLLPLDALSEDICRLAALLEKTCGDCGVTLLGLRARLVYPAEFNDLIDHFGSKGSALSHVTMELVRQVVDVCCGSTESEGAANADLNTPRPTRSLCIFLDKHGGRNRYAALLQHHFPESWIEPVFENRNRSRYRWMHGDTSAQAIFRVGCEELLPTALASMTAKYHREVAMRAFNAFWTSRIRGLRPTAGYPGDSHRFRADIAAAQRELGIDDRLLWRSR